MNDRRGHVEELVVAGDFSGVLVGAFADSEVDDAIFWADEVGIAAGLLPRGEGEFGDAWRGKVADGITAEEGGGESLSEDSAAGLIGVDSKVGERLGVF